MLRKPAQGTRWSHTSNLSKILHRRIFRLKILHRPFHLISTVLVRKTQKMSENGKIYTADKNFTLPPAVTAVTNSTSALYHSYHTKHKLSISRRTRRWFNWKTATCLKRKIHSSPFFSMVILASQDNVTLVEFETGNLSEEETCFEKVEDAEYIKK